MWIIFCFLTFSEKRITVKISIIPVCLKKKILLMGKDPAKYFEKEILQVYLKYQITLWNSVVKEYTGQTDIYPDSNIDNLTTPGNFIIRAEKENVNGSKILVILSSQRKPITGFSFRTKIILVPKYIFSAVIEVVIPVFINIFSYILKSRYHNLNLFVCHGRM